LMNKRGTLMWDVKLRSPVICMDTGDVTNDGKHEILVGLENKKLVVLDNQGNLLGEFILPEPIVGCTVGRPVENLLAPIFVVLKSGRVINVNHTGQWQEMFLLKDAPTCVTALKFRKLQALVVGTKAGNLKVFDVNGNMLSEKNLGGKIRCVNREIRLPRSDISILVAVGVEEQLVLFEAQIISDSPEESTPASFNAQKPHPVENAQQAPTPTHEDHASPVTSAPFAEKKGGQLEGTQFDLDLEGEWKYKFCRGCGRAISLAQRQRLADGYPVFCETCGMPLRPSDED